MTNDELLSQPLYKYRSFSDPYGRDNVQRIIVSNEMYWQTPDQFNDPYDCLPVYKYGETVRERERYVKGLVARRGVGTSRYERRQDRKRLNAITEPDFRERATKFFHGNAIMCFATERDQMLMWSHYSENHTGVCFAFKQVLVSDPMFVAVPVQYSDDRPTVDITKIGDTAFKSVESAVLRKARCWEYEREWRMFEPSGGAGFRQFPPQALTGVILGAKIRPDDKDFVLGLLAEHRPGIEILQASIDDHCYRLNFRPI